MGWPQFMYACIISLVAVLTAPGTIFYTFTAILSIKKNNQQT